MVKKNLKDILTGDEERSQGESGAKTPETTSHLIESSKKRVLDNIKKCPLLKNLYEADLLFYSDEFKDKPSLSKTAYTRLLGRVKKVYNGTSQPLVQQYVIEEAIKEISESFNESSKMQQDFVMAITNTLIEFNKKSSDDRYKFNGIHCEAVPEITRKGRSDYYISGLNVLRVSFATDESDIKDQLIVLKKVLVRLDLMVEEKKISAEEQRFFERQIGEKLLEAVKGNDLKKFKQQISESHNGSTTNLLESALKAIETENPNLLKKFNPLRIYKRTSTNTMPQPDADTQSLLLHEMSHAADHLITRYESSKAVCKYIIEHNDLDIKPLIESAMLLSSPDKQLIERYESDITGSGITLENIQSFADNLDKYEDAQSVPKAILTSTTSTEFLTFNLENIFAHMQEDSLGIVFANMQENNSKFRENYKIHIENAINLCRAHLQDLQIDGVMQSQLIGHAIGIVAASMHKYTQAITTGREQEIFAQCLMVVPEILHNIRSEQCPEIIFPPIATHQAISSSHVQASSNLSPDSQIPNVQEGDGNSEEEGDHAKPPAKRHKPNPSSQGVFTPTPKPQAAVEITPQNVYDSLIAIFPGQVRLHNSDSNEALKLRLSSSSDRSEDWVTIPNEQLEVIAGISSNDESILEKQRLILDTVRQVQSNPSSHLHLSTKSDPEETTKTSTRILGLMRKRKMPDKEPEKPEATAQKHADVPKSHVDKLKTQESGGRGYYD